MRAARRAIPALIGVALALALALALAPHPAHAQAEHRVLLVLVDGVSYEQALSDPALASLAGHGGIGLMTTRVARGREPAGSAAYVTLGAGAVAGAPPGPVTARPSDGGATLDVAPFLRESEGASPGALGEALRRAGRSVGYVGGTDGAAGVEAPGALVAMDRRGRIPTALLGGGGGPVPPDLLEDLDLLVLDLGSGAEEVGTGVVGLAIRTFIEASTADELLVLVAVPSPAAGMRERGDQVTPLIAAAGSPRDLLSEAPPGLTGLTSATTDREGLVANVDVAPTVLAFLGVRVPESMDGAVVREEGDAPGELHRRYLGVRAIRFPLQMLALGVAIGAPVAGGALLLLRRRAPRWAAGGASVGVLLAIALPIALLPVGVLPEPGYGSALLVAGSLTVGIVAAGLWWGRADPMAPVAIVAGSGLGILLLDAIRGWPTMVTPVIGGGALEGARFFGLGNAYVGVLLAGAVLVAARLPVAGGAALLAGAGLFVGLPRLGSNLGGAITLFAATGLWIALRSRGRLRLPEIAMATAVTAAGALAVIAAHALIPAVDTHIAGAAEAPGDALEVLGRRLGINVRVTSEIPVAWLLPPALAGGVALAWRRVRPLDRHPAWRDACVVLGLAGLVGFVVNDTGVAVAGMGVAYLAAALAYPGLEERWRSP